MSFEQWGDATWKWEITMAQKRQGCSGRDLFSIWWEKRQHAKEIFPRVPRSIQLMELSGFKPAYPKNLRGL